LRAVPYGIGHRWIGGSGTAWDAPGAACPLGGALAAGALPVVGITAAEFVSLLAERTGAAAPHALARPIAQARATNALQGRLLMSATMPVRFVAGQASGVVASGDELPAPTWISVFFAMVGSPPC
jgi:hypothetical protein